MKSIKPELPQQPGNVLEREILKRISESQLVCFTTGGVRRIENAIDTFNTSFGSST